MAINVSVERLAIEQGIIFRLPGTLLTFVENWLSLRLKRIRAGMMEIKLQVVRAFRLRQSNLLNCFGPLILLLLIFKSSKDIAGIRGKLLQLIQISR